MLIKSYEILKKDLNFLNSFLIYGKNIGLKQDIVKSVIGLKEKKNIKYKQFKFEEEEIIKNQNDFFNLIFSGSLFDKKKVIFVNRTTDRLFNLISEISKKDIKDILIFFEADQLEKKSKIRNLFEKDKNLVCIACYQDNNFDLIKIINDEIKQTKIKLSTESINLLIERASGDRNNLKDLERIDFNKYDCIIDMCLFNPSQFLLLDRFIPSDTNYIFFRLDNLYTCQYNRNAINKFEQLERK